MSEWISVDDKVPENYGTVIVTDGDEVYAGFYSNKSNEWLRWTGWKNLDLRYFKVTHWMPLPKKPENI